MAKRSKTAVILENPDKSPKEVAKLAKCSAAYVCTVRYNHQRKKQSPGKKAKPASHLTDELTKLAMLHGLLNIAAETGRMLDDATS